MLVRGFGSLGWVRSLSVMILLRTAIFCMEFLSFLVTLPNAKIVIIFFLSSFLQVTFTATFHLLYFLPPTTSRLSKGSHKPILQLNQIRLFSNSFCLLFMETGDVQVIFVMFYYDVDCLVCRRDECTR